MMGRDGRLWTIERVGDDAAGYGSGAMLSAGARGLASDCALEMVLAQVPPSFDEFASLLCGSQWHREPQVQPYSNRLIAARQRAARVAESDEYGRFVELVRSKTPNRFSGQSPERFLRLVDHHLRHFVPKLLRSVRGETREVFDFGCGTGASSVALALVFDNARFRGTDINGVDVAIAEARAKLYGVDDRCHFESIGEGQALPVSDRQVDLCVCCSVLEYVTDPEARKFCVQEMARVITPGGLLFITVPNRIYPVEIHKRKLGWNYFPKWLNAQAVGSTAWEVKRLARPHLLKLHRTPLPELITPWTNFCLKKDG